MGNGGFTNTGYMFALSNNCTHVNNITGACSCPSGSTPTVMAAIPTGAMSQNSYLVTCQ